MISDVLRSHARAVGAEQWLEDLPSLIADLEQRWGIAVGVPFDGATEAYVAEVTTLDGDAAVLKVLLPTSADGARHEITALALANGEGLVGLLENEPELGALLLERLGPPLYGLGLPITQRHAILCDTAARAWRPAAGCGLPTGADRARGRAVFIERMWEKLDRPCSERAVAHALDCATRRASAHDDERAVLVHGDVHQLNALQAGAEFKLVDPDGVLAEAELDLGIIMRGDPVELIEGDPLARAHWLAARTGRDATAVWEWGIVERITSALHCVEIDFQPLGRDTLAAVEAVAGLDLVCSG